MWGTSRFPSRLSPTVVADSVGEVCLAKDKKEFLPWNPDETFWQLPFCRCDWMTSKFPLSSMSLWNSKRCHYSEQLLPIKKLLNLVLCSPRAALRKGLVSRHETRSPGCCWEALSPALLFYWAEKTQLRKRQHPPHLLQVARADNGMLPKELECGRKTACSLQRSPDKCTNLVVSLQTL